MTFKVYSLKIGYEVIEMADYRKINNRLIIALNDIIDKAKAAIEEAEEIIMADEAGPPKLRIVAPKEDK